MEKRTVIQETVAEEAFSSRATRAWQNISSAKKRIAEKEAKKGEKK